MTDLGILKDWLGLIAVMISVGVFFHSWLTSGSKTNAAALAELREEARTNKSSSEKKLIDLDRRVQSIETEWKHLPDAQSVNDLKLAITEMRGSMNVQAEVMNSVARTVQRLENYLLEKGK